MSEWIAPAITAISHFYNAGESMKYRGVALAPYLFYEFYSHIAHCRQLTTILKASDLNALLKDFVLSDVHRLLDEPFLYNPGRGGKILGIPVEFLREVWSLLPAELKTAGCRAKSGTQAGHSVNARELAAPVLADPVLSELGVGAWLIPAVEQAVLEIDQAFGAYPWPAVGCVLVRTVYRQSQRAVVAIANSLGIPSVSTHPGGLLGNTEKFFPIADVPIGTTIKTAWGPFTQSYWQKYGIPSHRIRITGNPRFDRLGSLTAADGLHLRAQLGIDPARPVVLLTPQAPAARQSKMLRFCLAALQQTSDYALVVKPRKPNEYARYREMTQGMSRVYVIEPKADLHKAILAADVVVTYYSTSGMEALLLHRPLITIDQLDQANLFSYAAMGGSLPVYTPTELAGTLNNLRHPEAQAAFWRRAEAFLTDVHPPRWDSAPRIADAVLEQLRQGR